MGKTEKILYEETFEGENSPFTVQVVKPPAAKVTLIDTYRDPERTVAMLTRGYKGIYDGAEISDADVQEAFQDVVATRLQDPLASVGGTWLLNNVSRAFTHQLVRYSQGTRFIQESMRFYGLHGVYKVLATGKIASSDPHKHDPTLAKVYCEAAVGSVRSYNELVLMGADSQDARGILPTNILTNVFFTGNLLNLLNIVTQRMCCQAQHPEWLPVIMQVRSIVRETMGDRVADLLKAPVELGRPCGYNASFDRPCTWKNGIKASGEYGSNSEV